MKLITKLYPKGGKRAFNGLASNYNSHYPIELQPHIKEGDFNKIIKQINKTLQNYWSCDFCHYFGWGFALCTFGLSFLGNYVCVKDAQEQAQIVIQQINEFQLEKLHLHIELKVQCGRSWLEFSKLVDLQDFNNTNMATESEMIEL